MVGVDEVDSDYLKNSSNLPEGYVKMPVDEYKRQFNSNPYVKDAGIEIVDKTLNSIKTLILYLFLVVIVILFVWVFLIYSNKLSPVNNNNFTIQNDLVSQNNFTISPVVYVGVYLSQNITNQNYTLVNVTTYEYINNTYLNNSIENEGVF